MSDLAYRLDWCQRRQGLSNKALAVMAGVGRATVEKYRTGELKGSSKGRGKAREALTKLAGVLGGDVEVAWLAEGTGSSPNGYDEATATAERFATGDELAAIRDRRGISLSADLAWQFVKWVRAVDDEIREMPAPIRGVNRLQRLGPSVALADRIAQAWGGDRELEAAAGEQFMAIHRASKRAQAEDKAPADRPIAATGGLTFTEYRHLPTEGDHSPGSPGNP